MNPPAYVSLMDRYVAEGGFAGAALLAAQHGKLVLEHYAGNAAPDLPASATVLWPLASISKVYTAGGNRAIDAESAGASSAAPVYRRRS